MCFVLAVVFCCVSVSKRFQCGFNVIFSGFSAGPAKEPSVASAQRRHIWIFFLGMCVPMGPALCTALVLFGAGVNIECGMVGFVSCLVIVAASSWNCFWIDIFTCPRRPFTALVELWVLSVRSFRIVLRLQSGFSAVSLLLVSVSVLGLVRGLRCSN